MRIHTTTLTLIASAALFGCGKATQPKPSCRTQQNVYAAHFLSPQVVEGTCDGKMLVGEVMHLAFYRSAPQGGIPKAGIEPASVADAVHAAESATPPVAVELMGEDAKEYSLGKFKDAYPDDNDICEVPTFEKFTGVKIAMIPPDPMVPMDTGHPAVELQYKWSKMRFITQPLSNAIHFGADLERKDGDCVIKYKVSAIYPVIHCGNGTKPKVDEMGNPVVVNGEPVLEPNPEDGEPDDANCKPSIKGDKSGKGSGLSPDYSYACLPKPHLFCAPTKAFPARVASK
jgi:hypothetical protein